jgi:serine/threonine protein kinase
VSVGRDFIGPFQLLRLVRAGTTTQVWEAVRTGQKERVALKVLTSAFRSDKGEIAQLKHEADIGKELDHRNVIKIFDYHDDAGIPLIAMELFHARNLKISMREQPEKMMPMLSPIIRRCAKGLREMHQKGWVHCDVKPDNFLADDEGQLKLIDFSIGEKIKKKGGLGKLFGGRSKTAKGTRSYMAPEQIRRKNPDARTDIYGLGCMIFELMSGKTPFTGNTPDELLNRHLTATIPSLESCSDASADFAGVVKRMLAKKPDQRYQSMEEFLGVLKRCQIFRPGKRPEGFQR